MAKKAKAGSTRYSKSYEVKFTSVGIGHDKARIGASIGGAEQDLDALREMFVGSQLACELSVDPNAKGDAEGQEKLVNGDDLELEGVADSTRLGVFSDRVAVSLQFGKSSIDVGLLSRLSSLKGKLRCKRIGAASSPESTGDLGDEDGDE